MAKKIKIQDLQIVDTSGIEALTRKYEIMLVLPTDITVDQRQTVISEFEELIKEAKADVYHIDDWGKRDLAFDIKGREEAYYLIYYINLQDTSKIQEITNNLRLQANLLRYLIVKRDFDYEIQNFADKDEYEKNSNEFRSEVKDEDAIDYKNLKLLRRYTTRYAKIVPRQYSKITLRQQKRIAREIKKSRHVALLPFVS
ncbi:30S ribosomal protein S6 [bacterium]|jgi:ribosomal protein S6/ribosomal protein S18|nr:30S ribosomal protein S6 [bacterium]MBT6293917.1 30S ribosomal protein S6 [bacterium]